MNDERTYNKMQTLISDKKRTNNKHTNDNNGNRSTLQPQALSSSSSSPSAIGL